MKVGYARISTKSQSLDSQIDSLKKAECKKIFTDQISGVRENRPGLDELLNFVRPGDEVVIFSLSRLGRSLKELIKLVDLFDHRQINLTSLTEDIETKTPMGRLIFHLFAALSAFERELIIERTKAGLQSARARGRFGGRPNKLSDFKKKQIISLYESKKYSISELIEEFGVSKTTIYNYIKSKDFKI